MSSLKKFDLILIFLFFMLSASSSYWAYQLYLGTGEKNNKVVGKATVVDNDVFKKGEEEFFYINIGQGRDIHENDQITTGLESNTTISLGNGGSTLSLKELSHVVIKFENNIFAMEIKSGEITATLSQGEAILIDGDRIIKNESGSTEIKYIKNSKGSQYSILKGKASVLDKKSKTMVEAKPMAKAPASSVQLNQPEMHAHIHHPLREIDFKWTDSRPTNQEYNLKIFSKNKLLQSQKIKGYETKLVLPEAGEYQWLIEKTSEDASTIIQDFTLLEAAPFILSAPAAEGKIHLKPVETEAEANFAWEQNKEEPVQLIVEKQTGENVWEAFSKTPVQGLKNNQFTSKLPPGLYRWQVVGDHANSDWNSFLVLEAQIPLLPPPKIADIEKIVDKKIRTEGAAANWPPISEASGYEVEFKGQIYPTKIAGILFPEKDACDEKYRVRTLNSKQLAGEWSPLKKFILKVPPKKILAAVPKTPSAPPPAPEPEPEVAQTAVSDNGIEIPKVVSPDSSAAIISGGDIASVDIKVESLACADYEVEIDRSETFLNPTILKLETGKGQIDLQKGSYRIRARCWKEGDMGNWSVVRKFKIQ